jgi:hypothetical protein
MCFWLATHANQFLNVKLAKFYYKIGQKGCGFEVVANIKIFTIQSQTRNHWFKLLEMWMSGENWEEMNLSTFT